MTGKTEKHLESLGIQIPIAPAPAANYVPFVMTGNQLHISGQLPMGPQGLEHEGKLGADVEIAQGQEAARLCAINILAQAKAALGELDRITQVVKINGFVNSTPDFGDQPAVINGASNFLAEALGDRGTHARCAVGMAALPFGAAVEIDAILTFE